MTVPWLAAPELDIECAVGMERRFADADPTLHEKGRMLLHALADEISVAGLKGARLKALATTLNMRTKRRFEAEAKALANAVQRSWQEVLVMNLSYELASTKLGCSTAILAGDDGPVLARNMDWYPEQVLARSSALIRYAENGRLLFANAGWPGSIGVVSGLAGKGFGIVVNFVHAPEGVDWLGYPVLLHIRRVLEDASGFEEAVDMLASERLAAGALFSVVGTENQERAVVERTTSGCAIRRPHADEPLVTTNHYASSLGGSTMDHPNPVGCPRWQNLLDVTASMTGRSVQDDRLLYELSDPGVIQGITAQHVIIRPRQNTIRLFVPRRLVDAESFQQNENQN
ncbi:MAG: C45 family autoproteolytic acyltransferase/hydrolase [Phycisphaerae bacterium]